MSEMSSQLDFFREGPQTGVYPSIRGKSSPLDQNTSAHTNQTIPFMLSPLNEFDEEYENPLNKAMIIESTATGFTWSKRKEDLVPTSNPCMLISSDGDLVIKDDSVPNHDEGGGASSSLAPLYPNPFKLKEEYDALNHSFWSLSLLELINSKYISV